MLYSVSNHNTIITLTATALYLLLSDLKTHKNVSQNNTGEGLVVSNMRTSCMTTRGNHPQAPPITSPRPQNVVNVLS